MYTETNHATQYWLNKLEAAYQFGGAYESTPIWESIPETMKAELRLIIDAEL